MMDMTVIYYNIKFCISFFLSLSFLVLLTKSTLIQLILYLIPLAIILIAICELIVITVFFKLYDNFCILFSCFRCNSTSSAKFLPHFNCLCVILVSHCDFDILVIMPPFTAWIQKSSCSQKIALSCFTVFCCFQFYIYFLTLLLKILYSVLYYFAFKFEKSNSNFSLFVLLLYMVIIFYLNLAHALWSL